MVNRSTISIYIVSFLLSFILEYSSNIFNETKKPVENISNSNEILNDEFVNFSLPSINEEESLMPDIGAYWTGTPVTNDNNTDLKNKEVVLKTVRYYH